MQTSAVLFLFALPVLVRSQALPSSSKPTAYHLNIYVPDLATSTTFNGSLEINVTVTTSLDKFTLHAEGLDVDRSSVSVLHHSKFKGWRPENVADVEHIGSLLVIKLERPGVTGDYLLRLEYKGTFQNRMAGFCKVGYHFNRMQKYMAVTNFDPTNARKVFPCYDEPWHRTKITLDITVNKSLTVFSNVGRTYVRNVTDTTRVFRFDGYPELPIHSLGWVVLDPTTFQLQNDTSGATVVHTRAPYPYSNHTAWANRVTASLLDALRKYTEQDAFLTKLEQIVIPEFFVGSAEGWGIISYSEEAILVTPQRSSAQYTQQVALGLAGGLAHQWFGDLVSMDSWHNTWLTTGLTEHLKYTVTGSLEDMKDWELAEQEIVEMVQPALALDVSGHALVDNTNSEDDEVREACDDITKYKGGAIILMLHNILKDDIFKSGLSVYLSSAHGQTSTPGDLWNVLYEAAQESDTDLGMQSVNTIMDEWASTPGHPTLSVAWNNTHFIISQPSSGRWTVPVTYMLQNSPERKYSSWLHPGSSLVVPSSEPQWILLNVNQTGFYRVNYETALWQRLIQQLQHGLTRIPRLNRAQLVDDMFALAQNGMMSYSTLLNYTQYLRSEIDYYPWRTALRHFHTLVDKLYGHSSYKLLKQHLVDLLSEVVSDVGLVRKPQDSHVAKLKRAFILEKACSFNHTACVHKSVSMLRSWMSSTFFDEDLTTSLLCSGIANSPTGVWRAMWNMLQYSIVPSVRASVLRALTCTQDQPVLNEFLTNITSRSASLVSSKDRTVLLQTLASTPFGAEVLLDWLLQKSYAQMNQTAPAADTSAHSVPSTSVAPQPQANLSGEDVKTQASIEQPESTTAHSLTVRSSAVTDTLLEEDVLAILSYILPKLTTTEQAFKLDALIALNSTEISNSTLAVMKRTAVIVHQQADWASTNSVNITTWLKDKIAPTTGPADVSTVTHSPSPTSPSGAATAFSSLVLSTLAAVALTIF